MNLPAKARRRPGGTTVFQYEGRKHFLGRLAADRQEPILQAGDLLICQIEQCPAYRRIAAGEAAKGVPLDAKERAVRHRLRRYGPRRVAAVQGNRIAGGSKCNDQPPSVGRRLPRAPRRSVATSLVVRFDDGHRKLGFARDLMCRGPVQESLKAVLATASQNEEPGATRSRDI